MHASIGRGKGEFMRRKLSLASAGIGFMVFAAPALAHFQMLYVEESARVRGGTAEIALIFTHPFAAGPTMEMGAPEAFYMIAQRGDDGEAVRTEGEE